MAKENQNIQNISSPAEAGSQLHELHQKTVGLPQEIIGAGAILRSGIELDSGLLVPRGTKTAGETSEELAEDITTASVESTETEKTFEQRVEDAVQALAEHYAEFGAKPEDFGLISYEDDEGKKVSAVMYTASKGLDLGVNNRSYDSIMDNDSAHKVKVGSQEVDTRRGMTKDLYYAFSDGVRRSDLAAVPDKDNGADDWSITLLTGEPADHNMVPCGRFGYNCAEMVAVSGEDNRRNIRFRPSVEMIA